jgi:hypothetical protein
MTKSKDNGTKTPLEIGNVVFCANKTKIVDGKA